MAGLQDGTCIDTKKTRALLQLFRRYLHIIPGVNIPRRLPCHHHVVLCRRCQMPTFLLVGTPRKVRGSLRVTTVYKDKLGWSILGVVGGLLFANLANVPNVYSAVR